MKKIKVIHILNSLGGVDTSLRMITENLDSNKYENIIIHGKKDNGNFIDNKNNKLKEYLLPIEREINLFKDLTSLIKAIRIVLKERPDIIHGHSAKGGLLANLCGRFIKSAKVFHTPQAYSYLTYSNKYKRKIFILVEKFLKSKNTILLASSESESIRGLKDIGYSKENILLFNNSIKKISVEPNSSVYSNYKLPQDFICTVGRPSYQKNIELMVEIIMEVKKTIPNIHLVVMGLGVVSPNTENVKKLISKYNLENNITLIEWLDRKEIFNIVIKSKFYISTARYEGLPYAILEALALKKAIIATDVDGNRDVVKNTYNGYLLKEDQIDLFVEKTVELLTKTEIKNKFETNSFKLFNEKFNIDNNIKILDSIYSKYG